MNAITFYKLIALFTGFAAVVLGAILFTATVGFRGSDEPNPQISALHQSVDTELLTTGTVKERERNAVAAKKSIDEETTEPKAERSPAGPAAGKAEIDRADDGIDDDATATRTSSPSAPQAPLPKDKPQAATHRTGHDTDLDEKLNTVFKPLINISVSDADKKKTKDALKLARKGKYDQANKMAAAISDPGSRELVLWYVFKQSAPNKPFSELQSFITKNEDWPFVERFRRYAEARLYREQIPASKVLAYFANQEPATGFGKIALAQALFKKGDKDKATKLVKSAWRNHNLSRPTETLVIKNYIDLLNAEDHRARVNRFLFTDSRKQAKRGLRAAQFLSKTERKKIDAWVAVIGRQRKATKLLSGLSAEAKKDPGIVFARARWARYRKKKKQAVEILKNAPATIESPVPIDGWWKEIRRHVVYAMDSKNYSAAYEIAKRRGPITVNYRNEAEFMAGWIALRHLKKAERALKHFQAFNESADGPRTRGKSNYWLGRAALRLGKIKQAKAYFREGAKEFNTFYGQLSLQALDEKLSEIDVPPPPLPNDEMIKRFVSRKSVRALVAAHLNDRGDLENNFFARLKNHLEHPEEFVLLAELAKQLGNVQQSIRIGKRGMFLKMDMAHYAYPTHSMPAYKPLRSSPEKPFLFSITRQESEFNPNLVSHAGARGLMQVMPGTARHLARRYKIKYSKSKLISDPSYNVRLASAYISDGLDEFNGNYAMTMAGFNAGPGRVRQWVKQFGDPRTSAIDPIDWIERIPFSETRNYVLKVMSNIQIYRARLGDSKNALRIIEDLYGSRARHSFTLADATN